MGPQPVDEISADPRAISSRAAWVIAVVLLAAALAGAITIAVHYRSQAAALRRHLPLVRAPAAPPSAAPPELFSSTTALPASGTLAGEVTAVTARSSAGSAEVIVTASVICQEHGTRVLPRPRDHLAAAGSSWG